MLKWEKYKSLTKEQKEEYRYKFKEKPIILNVTGMTYSIVILMGIITLFMFSLYINNKEKIMTNQEMTTMLLSIAPLIKVIMYILLIYVIGALIQLFYYAISEHIWKKKNLR